VSSAPVLLSRAETTLEDVRLVARDGALVEVGSDVAELVQVGRRVVEDALDADYPVYGLNTGLGHTRDQKVSRDVLLEYQERLITVHHGGVGKPLPDDDVRALVFARAVGIARGGSGATPAVLDGLVALLNHGVLPVVPEAGSVGASDLGHMGAVGCVLSGRSRATYQGEVLPAAEALARAGLRPVTLQPKDAIAILNSNATSIGIGALTVLDAERVARLADLASALTLEAISGNLTPFDPEANEAKPFPGQLETAARVLELLEGSYLKEPGAAVSLQDPLSIRTIPQVTGAWREQIAFARRAVATELNGRGDNPLVSPESGRAFSTGNFHALVLALAFDALRVGLAHVGTVSERRIAKITALRWARMDVEEDVRDESWRSSAFRLAGLVAYAAAAISGELKQLAGPVTLGAPPLDLDVEDHATLAPQTVFTTRYALGRLELVLTVEALVAVDALASAPPVPRLGAGTAPAYQALTAMLAGLDRDELTATAVERARGLLLQLAS
jgi:histidine ammonia-lyase